MSINIQHMKLKRKILRIGFLVLCLVVASTACSQDIPKTYINKKTVVTSKPVIKKKVETPAKAVPAKSEKPQSEKEIPAAKSSERRAKEAESEKQTGNGQKAPKSVKAQPKEKERTASKAKTPQPKRVTSQNAKADSKRTESKKPQPTPAKSHPFVALKTNVPFLAAVVQNLALEVQVHKHISVDFPVMWSISDIERKHGLRTIAFQPEGRWWLKSVGEGGHFFGVHAHAAWFNLKWEENRYQTEQRPLAGAGVSYGYRLPLGEHWGAEFNVGFGYANMKYNTYYNIENGAYIDTRIRNYWGITRAGLSLVYRF